MGVRSSETLPIGMTRFAHTLQGTVQGLAPTGSLQHRAWWPPAGGASAVQKSLPQPQV